MTDRESYIRQETVTGVVPMLKGDRQYSFLDLFLSTSGFAIATWCYTQGAYVAQYLSFSRMLINIFCFNIVCKSGQFRYCQTSKYPNFRSGKCRFYHLRFCSGKQSGFFRWKYHCKQRIA